MRIQLIAYWLSRNFPQVYRLARPPWRLMMRLFGHRDYWQQRKHFNYYREVVRLARTYVPSGRYVIDVGANDTEVILDLSWFAHRVALDLVYAPRRAGVESILIDFMDYHPNTYFDLVLCLQVLEHLENPGAFAQKLLETGKVVIITVPYKWPAELVKTHTQDPVDEAKLERWTRRKPVETLVVTDGKERLIAVYRNEDY
ncbi:MAG: class I SAM-dependent methyltransferase [Candidatus Binatia bacterium]